MPVTRPLVTIQAPTLATASLLWMTRLVAAAEGMSPLDTGAGEAAAQTCHGEREGGRAWPSAS